MKREIWKPYPGLEGVYEVSNTGRVRSLDRVCVDKNGRKFRRKGKVLSQYKNRKGYKMCMFNNKNTSVHRLVAKVFIPNPDPDNKTQVNHKDGNKDNNHVSNLEWVTGAENHTHAWDNGLRNLKQLDEARRKQYKRVNKYTLDGRFIKQYPSIHAAARSVNTSPGNITECCKGKRNKAKGFKWKYA